MKSFLQNIALSLITLFVMLLLLEGVFRVYYHFRGYKATHLDEALGWDVVHDYQTSTTKTDFAKKTYPCTYSIDKNGFRKYGDVNTKKIKVLFVGDSFTQAEDATDDSTYFAVAAQKANIEVFAYGVGGFGSLQEMMILETHIAQIKPNLVVMQFTSNDFINNCYDLEYRSIQNNSSVRPYLTAQNTIVYRFPKNYPSIRNFANHYSRFLYFIINRIDNLSKKPDNFQLADYTESVQATSLVYQRIKGICQRQKAGLVSFMVDGVNTTEANFYHQIMQKLNIEILAEVPIAIEEATKAGTNCKAADGGHWNNTGHRICGTLLAEKIIRELEAVRRPICN